MASKYIKDKDNQSNNGGYLSSSSKYLWENEKSEKEEGNTSSASNNQIVREHSKGKSTSASSFNNSNIPEEAKESPVFYRSKEAKKEMLIKRVTLILALLLSSILLAFIQFEFPFIPSFLKFDFAIFPELVLVVFFGPIVGASAVVVKNLVHLIVFYIIHSNISYVGELSNFITDITFIMLAFFVNIAITEKFSGIKLTRKKRVLFLFISGAISSLSTAVFMLPVMKFVIYPLFVRYFAGYGHSIDFLNYYTEKLPSIANVWQGLFVFNLPFEFSKLLSATIFATITYALITSQEHKRREKIRRKREQNNI